MPSSTNFSFEVDVRDKAGLHLQDADVVVPMRWWATRCKKLPKP